MTSFQFPFSNPQTTPLDEKGTEFRLPHSGRRVSVTSRVNALPSVGYTPRSRHSRSISSTGSVQSPDVRTPNNWRSKLRRPHPFLSREPNGYPHPTSKRDEHTDEQKRQTGKHKIFSVKDILLFVALLFSLVVFIIGCIQSHDITTTLNKEIKLISTSPANLTTTKGTPVPASKPSASAKPSTKTSNKDVDLFARVFDTHVELDIRKDNSSDQGKSNLGPYVTAIPNGSNSTDTSKLNISSIPLLENDAMYLLSHRNLAMTTLILYTNTMPFVSIIYVSAELAIVLLLASSAIRVRKPRPSSPEDFDFDSDAETISGEEENEKWKHIGPAFTDSLEKKKKKKKKKLTRFEKWQTHMPMLSVIASCIVVAGWVAIVAVQSHCELTPHGDKAEVCPILLRRSSAKVFDLSIVRSVFSWLTIIVYLAFIAATVVSGKALRRTQPRQSHSIDINNINRIISPPSNKPILRTRGRSSSLRRKTVRFSFENEAAQQEFADDGVQYIPAPLETENRPSIESRTPWQWQGGFVNDSQYESKNKERNLTAVIGAYGRNASQKVSAAPSLSSHPTKAVRKSRLPDSVYDDPSPKPATEQTLPATTYEQRGGSFDLGLSSTARGSRQSALMRERSSLDERRSKSSMANTAGLKPNFTRYDNAVSAKTDGRPSADVKRVSRIEEERI